MILPRVMSPSGLQELVSSVPFLYLPFGASTLFSYSSHPLLYAHASGELSSCPEELFVGIDAGYQRLDYAIGVLLKDMGKAVTVSYAHNVDATTAAGAEVTKRLDDKDTTSFTLGCAPMLFSW